MAFSNNYKLPALSNNTALLFAAEAVGVGYGTDATPPATAAYTGVNGRFVGPVILDGNMTPVQDDVKMIATNPVRASFTKRLDVVGRALRKITFDAFLHGDGATGGHMPWMIPLLETCGLSMQSCASAAGSASWAMTPTIFPLSGSFYYHSAKVREKILGCYGTAKLNFPAGDAVKANFEFTGLYTAPEDNVSFPTLTYPSFVPKQAENLSLTITPSGGSTYTPIASNVTLDLASTSSEEADVNSDKGLYGIFHSNRQSMLDIAIRREDVITNFNPFVIRDNATLCDITWTFGSVALGWLWTVQVLGAQLQQCPEADQGGKKVFNTRWKLQNGTDNGDLKIQLKQAI